jgi:ribosomal protein S18 acetylase RimI-like enzyme
MTHSTASAIAQLINSQNQLTRTYTADAVLRDESRYIVYTNEANECIGVVEVKLVQWYQCEIDHLSVHPLAKRMGIGRKLISEAEKKAISLGARIVQCTIRRGNVASESAFQKNGYIPSVSFRNDRTGNEVTVFQKVLTAALQYAEKGSQRG